MRTLEDFLHRVPVVELSKNYWFFRTMGGYLYEPFFYKSFIALDYSKITESKVKDLIDGKISEGKISFIKEMYPENKRPGLVLSNLKRFYSEMSAGDYIIIPDVAGKRLAVGEILGDVEEIKGVERVRFNGKVYLDEEYRRARRVKWVSVTRRSNFSLELLRLLNTHQTISLANEYAEGIDRLLYAFYKKGDRYYYTFSVGQKHSLSAKTVYGTFYELLNIVDEFLESEGVHETTDAVNTRIVLTSPGFVEFFGSAGSAIATIALLVFFVCGGVVKFRVKDSFELDLGSEGILKRLNEFLNSRQDRKIKATLLSKIASLEIKVSDDVVKIMTAANEKNQNK